MLNAYNIIWLKWSSTLRCTLNGNGNWISRKTFQCFCPGWVNVYLIFEKCPKYLRECIPQCPGILPNLIMTTIISFVFTIFIYIQLLDGLSLFEICKATDNRRIFLLEACCVDISRVKHRSSPPFLSFKKRINFRFTKKDKFL